VFSSWLGLLQRQQYLDQVRRQSNCNATRDNDLNLKIGAVCSAGSLAHSHNMYKRGKHDSVLFWLRGNDVLKSLSTTH